jgi:hypothetical protein
VFDSEVLGPSGVRSHSPIEVELLYKLKGVPLLQGARVEKITINPSRLLKMKIDRK